MYRKKIIPIYLILIFFGLHPVYSQHNYQTDFPPEEFKSRWEGVFEKIGDNGIAIIQGFPQPNGYIMPRQTNAFYYLSGIETPHSYLVLDGRSKQATLYMPPANKKLEKSEGKVLSSNDGPLIKKLVGVDQVKSTNDMKNNFPISLTYYSIAGDNKNWKNPISQKTQVKDCKAF